MPTEKTHDAQGNSNRPWHLVLLLPNAQHQTIAQFRNRQDAEDSLRAMRRIAPDACFDLMFVPSTVLEDEES